MPNYLPTSHFVWFNTLRCHFILLIGAYRAHKHAFYGRMCSVCFCLDLSTFLLVLCLSRGSVCILGAQPLFQIVKSVLWLHLLFVLPCPRIKVHSDDFLPYGISDNFPSIRTGVNKSEINICFMLTLISHTGIEANDLMHSDSAPCGVFQTIEGLICLPLAEEYIKIMRQKTLFELALYFALDMYSCILEEPDEVTQLCCRGCCTAILFTVILFTVEVSDLGVMEMEQA